MYEIEIIMQVIEIIMQENEIIIYENEIIMHENEIIMHKNEIIMHDDEIIMHGNEIIMHENEIIMHEISMPQFCHVSIYDNLRTGIELKGYHCPISPVNGNLFTFEGPVAIHLAGPSCGGFHCSFGLFYPCMEIILERTDGVDVAVKNARVRIRYVPPYPC